MNRALACQLVDRLYLASHWVPLPCPCMPGHWSKIDAIIVHLNDDHHAEAGLDVWTRDQIADWLETLDVDLTIRKEGP